MIRSFVIFVLAAASAIYERSRGWGWAVYAFVSILFFMLWLDQLDEKAKDSPKGAHTAFRQWLRFAAFLFMVAVTIYDAFHGAPWWPAFLLSLLLLFIWWTAGLPDATPPPLEPNFDPNKPPELPLKDAILSGSDADFTYCIHEGFPWTDWKDMAEDTLELFLPHIPELRYEVARDDDQTVVTLELGSKRQSIELAIAAEATQLIGPLAAFLAPDFILCSYRFTEGSDTWANPVFASDFWEKLKRERPDRASLLTPLIDQALQGYRRVPSHQSRSQS